MNESESIDIGRGSLRRLTAVRSSTDATRTLDVSEFPGRWNPHRSVPEFAERLAVVAGEALEASGWWRRGSGEPVRGGLVVGLEGLCERRLGAFAREVRESPVVGPGGFLAALPSSIASVLGLLYGLSEYQATMVGEEGTALRAWGHALDQLERGRLDRVLLAISSEARTGLALPAARSENPGPVAGPCNVAIAIEVAGDGPAALAPGALPPDRSRRVRAEPLGGDECADGTGRVVRARLGGETPLSALLDWLAPRGRAGSRFASVDRTAALVAAGYRVHFVPDAGDACRSG